MNRLKQKRGIVFIAIAIALVIIAVVLFFTESHPQESVANNTVTVNGWTVEKTFNAVGVDVSVLPKSSFDSEQVDNVYIMSHKTLEKSDGTSSLITNDKEWGTSFSEFLKDSSDFSSYSLCFATRQANSTSHDCVGFVATSKKTFNEQEADKSHVFLGDEDAKWIAENAVIGTPVCVISSNVENIIETGKQYFNVEEPAWEDRDLYLSQITNDMSLLDVVNNTNRIIVVDRNRVIVLKQTEGYSISFNASGGNGNMGTQTVETGYGYTVPDCNYKKDGYLFSNWTDASGNEVLNAGDMIKPTGDIVLYAVWKPIQYTLLLDYADGNNVTSINCTYDEKTILPSQNIDSSSCISGWENTLTGENYQLGQEIINNLTIIENETVTLRATNETDISLHEHVWEDDMNNPENKLASCVADGIHYQKCCVCGTTKSSILIYDDETDEEKANYHNYSSSYDNTGLTYNGATVLLQRCINDGAGYRHVRAGYSSEATDTLPPISEEDINIDCGETKTFTTIDGVVSVDIENATPSICDVSYDAKNRTISFIGIKEGTGKILATFKKDDVTYNQVYEVFVGNVAFIKYVAEYLYGAEKNWGNLIVSKSFSKQEYYEAIGKTLIGNFTSVIEGAYTNKNNNWVSSDGKIVMSQGMAYYALYSLAACPEWPTCITSNIKIKFVDGEAIVLNKDIVVGNLNETDSSISFGGANNTENTGNSDTETNENILNSYSPNAGSTNNSNASSISAGQNNNSETENTSDKALNNKDTSTVDKNWIVADEKLKPDTSNTIASSAIQATQSKSQLLATADTMRWILIFACSIGAAGFLIIGIWNTSRKI